MVFNQLEKKDHMKILLRAYFLRNGFNYGNYQGLDYVSVFYPVLRKMYKDDDNRLQEALKENIEFFNTSIRFPPFITSLHLVMLENKTPSNEIRSVEMVLTGSLAGTGNSPAQFCLTPLFTTIGAPLAQDGLIMGSIPFFVAMNMILLAAKFLVGMREYRLGINIITTLSTKTKQISNIASTIGATIISGLAVNFVKIPTPIQYVTNTPGDQQKVVVVWRMIDTTTPKLLPVLFIGLISYPIEVKEWTTYKLVILTIVLGVVLSVLNLIA